MSLMPPVDSVPNRIPDFLSPELFIPRSRLVGIQPWTSAPLPRPVVKVMTKRDIEKLFKRIQ